MQPRFLCLGLIMRDILISGVPELPSHWEQTLVADAVCSGTGGGAANSARTLGRLGGNVSLSGRVGRDEFAGAIRSDLAADHVQTNLLITDEAEPTGTAVALVHRDGRRCFTTVRGANRCYCARDLADIHWEDYPFIHINGYFQFPALEPALPRLLSCAKAAGCCISFDTASWDASGRWFESIRPFSEYLDYFFANDSQLEQLTGYSDSARAAAFLINSGVGNVIAKRGGDGCIGYYADGSVIPVGAFPAAVVDTTGAGDSFDAAYMLGVSKGWDAETCLRFANTVAGINCSCLGATAGVPDMLTAQTQMKNHYPA